MVNTLRNEPEGLNSTEVFKINSGVHSYAVLFGRRMREPHNDAELKPETDRRRFLVAELITGILQRHPPAERQEIAYQLEFVVRQQWRETIDGVIAEFGEDKAFQKRKQAQADNGLGRLIALPYEIFANQISELQRIEAARSGMHQELIGGAGI